HLQLCGTRSRRKRRSFGLPGRRRLPPPCGSAAGFCGFRPHAGRPRSSLNAIGARLPARSATPGGRDMHDKTLPTWHEGERLLQEKVGVVERMAVVGQRVVRDYMPDQHRDFYAQLPFIVLGSVDSRDDAWATFIEGRPGFMSSPSPTALDIAAPKDATDPASEGIADGKPVGLLGIEMHTRRRNRMNGF